MRGCWMGFGRSIISESDGMHPHAGDAVNAVAELLAEQGIASPKT